MKLDIFNTHLELYPYTKGDCPQVEDLFTAIDGYSKNEFPCGYFIDEGKLYLPRGTPVSKLEMWTGTLAGPQQPSDPEETMKKEHRSLYDPRNEIQEAAINFLLNNPNHQLAINLVTGFGKSYCCIKAATDLGIRTLVVSHNDGIKHQWIKTCKDMFDYRDDDLLNISGSDVMEGILNGVIQPRDINFVNHQTLRSFITSRGAFNFKKFFEKSGIGIKVYDESHLEFANILMVDAFSNTNRTWYLTATFDRSDKTESKCFKLAFSSLEAFGEEESKARVEKHVAYHVVNINSHPPPVLMRKIVPWNGMSVASYGNYAFFLDKADTAYETILMLLKKIDDLEGKILIFVPLIDAVDLVAKKLKADFPSRSIGVYHSKVDKAEKESVLKKDLIVSTIKSCGTGRDIPGLRVLINVTPIASKVQTQQLLGRLRPYADGATTYFYDIVDVAIPPINWWLRSRLVKIKELAKSITFINMT